MHTARTNRYLEGDRLKHTRLRRSLNSPASDLITSYRERIPIKIKNHTYFSIISTE